MFSAASQTGQTRPNPGEDTYFLPSYLVLALNLARVATNYIDNEQVRNVLFIQEAQALNTLWKGTNRSGQCPIREANSRSIILTTVNQTIEEAEVRGPLHQYIATVTHCLALQYLLDQFVKKLNILSS